jgi:hypothetical protein
MLTSVIDEKNAVLYFNIVVFTSCTCLDVTIRLSSLALIDSREL